MRRPLFVRVVLAAALASGASCASTQSRMHRALDPSMERVLATESYLWTVSGISGQPERLLRSDGYLYLSDIGPVMRYLALVQDSSRFRSLRRFVETNMLGRDSVGRLVPLRRSRTGSAFERATPYGDRFLRKALNSAWQQFSDSASAKLLASISWVTDDQDDKYDEMYHLTMHCADAVDVTGADLTAAAAVLKDADRRFNGLVDENNRLGKSKVAGGELDFASCLTRLAVVTNNPDATVRYLDRTLDILKPLLVHSGRPDLGTTADVLLTLRLVKLSGPSYYDPSSYVTKKRGP